MISDKKAALGQVWMHNDRYYHPQNGNTEIVYLLKITNITKNKSGLFYISFSLASPNYFDITNRKIIDTGYIPSDFDLPLLIGMVGQKNLGDIFNDPNLRLIK